MWCMYVASPHLCVVGLLGIQCTCDPTGHSIIYYVLTHVRVTGLTNIHHSHASRFMILCSGPQHANALPLQYRELGGWVCAWWGRGWCDRWEGLVLLLVSLVQVHVGGRGWYYYLYPLYIYMWVGGASVTTCIPCTSTCGWEGLVLLLVSIVHIHVGGRG